MKLRVLLFTLITGPFFSAFSLVTVFFVMGAIQAPDFFMDRGVETLGVYLGSVFISTIAGYLVAFMGVEELPPGLFPLIIYSVLFSVAVSRYFLWTYFKEYSRKTVVLHITLISMVVALLDYGLFFLLFSLSPKMSFVMLYMVLPTSIVLGVICGVWESGKENRKGVRKEEVSKEKRRLRPSAEPVSTEAEEKLQTTDVI
ncbi:hypothetical protein O5O45_22155 [Hahella aquimaris]|uniref:hypothetical protein n=1 Tax=Hahella sp. HNIBRBA332 TaxID=3015983 RepID=UPI00273AB316|nr:hypothetical protein [Hahella sp. HNIBRBA332]WLQ12434.1 hypothetical protein O5O45_22155 [Hahella sp. HNIBRBA332]